MHLLKLQQQFKDILLQKEGNWFLPVQGNVESTTGSFFLYQNNLYESLYKNLTDKFKMTKAWLGEDDFFKIAKDYIFTSPRYTPYLCEYGKEFSSTIENKVGRELAELEWRMNLSLISYRPEPALKVEDVVSLPPPLMSGCGFRFHPSIYLYATPYALKEIWIALKKGIKIPAYEKPSYFFISTENQQSAFSSINEAEYNFLNRIGEGKSLGEVYDFAADTHSFQNLLNKFISCFVEIRKKPF